MDVKLTRMFVTGFPVNFATLIPDFTVLQQGGGARAFEELR